MFRRSVVLAFALTAAQVHAAPAVSRLVPTSAPVGARFALEGSGLDAPDLTVSFAAGSGQVTATILSRTTTLLEGIVPLTAISGNVRVATGGGVVATLPFTVTPAPAYTSVRTLVGGQSTSDVYLKSPWGLVVLPSGIAYVADSLHHQVRIVATDGSVTVLAGSGKPGKGDGTGTLAEFNTPQGIAYDSALQVLYVADRDNHRIRRVTLDGVVTTLAGSGAGDADGTGITASFRSPVGLAVEPAGSLLVADSGNHKIRRVTTAGIVTTAAGTGKAGMQDGPAPSSTFKNPRGVAVVGGVIYVADSNNNVIRKIAEGIASTFAGNGHAGRTDGVGSLAEFDTPVGLAVGEHGMLYVGDYLNNTLRSINLIDRAVSTIAGTGAAGLLDGVPLAARFKQPAGLAAVGALFVADTNNDALRVLSVPPVVTGISPAHGPLDGGTQVLIFGTGFTPGTTTIAFDGVQAANPTWISSTLVRATTPPGQPGFADVLVTAVGGSFTLPASFEYINPASLVRISVVPERFALLVGATKQLSVTGTYADGTTRSLTSVAWAAANDAVGTIGATGLLTATGLGRSNLTASAEGLSAQATFQVTQSGGPPPDPFYVAPPLNQSIASVFPDAIAFLWQGPNPIQSGAPNFGHGVAVVRGRVFGRDGSPLSGVTVSVHGRAYLNTRSRDDGRYDLAVDGVGPVTFDFAKTGYAPVARQAIAPWNDFVSLPDVYLTLYDQQVTTIDLGLPLLQAARGSVVTDSTGTRQATMLFTPGTQATLQYSSGSQQPIGTLHVRATELSVGSNGVKAMPAELPPASGYTYCVDLSVDEAVASAATSVRFSSPVVFYVDDFLGLPAGAAIPVGYYDVTRGQWIPARNGRAIHILSVTNSLADIDSNGDGAPDAPDVLQSLGVSDAERNYLGITYTIGTRLWRGLLDHFTAWDFNHVTVPANANAAPPPNTPAPKVEARVSLPCTVPGSVIECQNQILRESIPITGTPLSLNYSSDRVPGHLVNRTVTIPITGPDTLPTQLIAITLDIDIAGQKHHIDFPLAPDQDYTFTWDGLDAYGRRVQGGQKLTYRVTYEYQALYVGVLEIRGDGVIPWEYFGSNASELSRTPGDYSFVLPARNEAHAFREQKGELLVGGWDARGLGLGGWTIDGVDFYDPLLRAFYEGSGERQTTDPSGDAIISTPDTPARRWADTFCQATGLPFFCDPQDMAVKQDDGTIYIVDRSLGKVYRDGRIVLSLGESFQGNSPPLTAIAVALDGTLYIGDGSFRIRRFIPTNPFSTGADYIVSTIYTGSPIEAIAVARDGNIYFADGTRIRRIAPNGAVIHVAGNGAGGYAGDGGPATGAELFAYRLAIANDGTVYTAGGFRVRRITPDGMITTVAGGGTEDPYQGGLATNAALPGPWAGAHALAVATDQTLYFTTHPFSAGRNIFRVAPDGRLQPIVGLTDGNPALTVGYPALATKMAVRAIGFHPDGRLIALMYQSVRDIEPRLPGLGLFTGPQIVSAGGDHYDSFQFNGKHLSSAHTYTNATMTTITTDSEGRIAALVDAYGNTVSVERSNDGSPRAFVAPGGQRTAVTLDANGFLASITNPSNDITHLIHDSGGLLQEYRDPKDQVHTFDYDPLGRLTRDNDPAGGSMLLRRQGSADSFEATVETTLGRSFRYAVERLPGVRELRTNTDSAGFALRHDTKLDQSDVLVSPDGTVAQSRIIPDPRFFMHYPVVAQSSVATPAGRIASTTTTKSAIGSTGLAISESTITKVNGRTFSLSYSGSSRTFQLTSPMGRTESYVIDGKGRLVQEQVAGFYPITYSYDTPGRLSTVSQGPSGATRSTSIAYDNKNRPVGFTDALGRTTSLTYDDADRPATVLLPLNRRLTLTYDADGNVASLTPPDRPPHYFTATPINLEHTYAAPADSSQDSPATVDYNLDHQITALAGPGNKLVAIAYDTVGRPQSVTTPEGVIGIAYNDLTGQVDTLTGPTPGVVVRHTNDGFLPTSRAYLGPVTGAVDFEWNNNFWLQRETINGAFPIVFSYDNDGALLQAGTLTITRSAQHGLPTATSLGNVTTTHSYSGFGEMDAQSAAYAGSQLFSQQFVRDNLGRITQKTETLLGQTDVYSYAYDGAARLRDVTRNGTLLAHYEYDANGNRTTKTTASGTLTASSDAQDRIIEYGPYSYSHSSDGTLASKTQGPAAVRYQYDALGNLRTVSLPSGVELEYLVDGHNRRIGKRINGALVSGLLWRGPLQPVAELDASGAVIGRYIYTTTANAPDYIVKGTSTYRLIKDYLGSPRLIVDSATGAILQRLDYDEFGQVINDTNPGFQPFGFAGGLYDHQTGLVRFGARDYDAQLGRWTAKDPIRFAGGTSGLYEYVGNDPINASDPLGLAKYVLIVGDPGLAHHNAGSLFQDAANTESASLRGQGHDVSIVRASNVDQFNAALNAHGTITGGVEYFGHSSFDRLYVGELPGASTNLDASNVDRLSGTNLGPEATITLNSCFAGSGGENSIAAMLARRLQRRTLANTRDFCFSNTPGRYSSKPGSAPKARRPLYMVPNPKGRWVIYN